MKDMRILYLIHQLFCLLATFFINFIYFLHSLLSYFLQCIVIAKKKKTDKRGGAKESNE